MALMAGTILMIPSEAVYRKNSENYKEQTFLYSPGNKLSTISLKW